jgi:hypothetical protein
LQEHDLSEAAPRLVFTSRLGAFAHPNMCTIREIGEHEGRPFIAMEMMKGRTLKHTIAGTPMEIHQVLALGAQIAGTSLPSFFNTCASRLL